MMSHDQQSVELLTEILGTLRSIEGRVVNIETEMKELKKHQMQYKTSTDGTGMGDTQQVFAGIANVKANVRRSVDIGDLNQSMEQVSLKEPTAKKVAQDEAKSPVHDSELAKQLRSITTRYLTAELTEDAKQKPKLVSRITEKFILPNLESWRSDVSYMGSAYEYTTVPGKSDYDIQFFIKLPHTKHNGQKILAAEVEPCGDAAWKVVKGGPKELLDSEGYLSTDKARRTILSEIDKALQKEGSDMEFEGDKVTIRRSTSGPATTLNVEWREEKISIDVVLCLKAADVKNSEFDLVAKPYDKSTADSHKYWRLSYSKPELELLRKFHKDSTRKLELLRIMKVIKQYQPQLKSFPSYFYKNILFKMQKDNPNAGWERIHMADRFKEIIQVIQRSLEDQNLPLHFNPQVNYLAGKDPKAITCIANYLKGIIKKEKYAELLSKVPTQ